jgi:hypothetical protein
MKKLLFIFATLISINCFSQTAKQVIGYPLGSVVNIHGLVVLTGTPSRITQGTGTDPDTLYVPSGITGGVINWPGTIFSTPTTATISSGTLTFAPSLASQTAWYVLGNHSSSSAQPTFGKIDVHSMNATGSTYDGSKVLYDDGTWKTPSGGGSSGLTATTAIDSATKYSITLKNGNIPHNGTGLKVGLMLLDSTAATSSIWQYPPLVDFAGRSWASADKYDHILLRYNPGDPAFYIDQYLSSSLTYSPTTSGLVHWATFSATLGGTLTLPGRLNANNSVITPNCFANDFSSGGGSNGVITLQSGNAPTSGNSAAMNSTTIGPSGDIQKTTGTFGNTVIRSVYNPTSATNTWYDLTVDSREKASTSGSHYLFAVGTNSGTVGDFSTFTPKFNIQYSGKISVAATNTTTGTTGNQTINQAAGKVNFAASATSLVVTNSLVTTSSIVIVTVEGTDATFTSARVTLSSGSFTINANAAATAETKVDFLVIN